VFIGSPTWARTRDLRINSPSLYRLSYRGIAVPAYAWVAIWESGILPADSVSRHCTTSMNPLVIERWELGSADHSCDRVGHISNVA
jgi:hypothetical protein